MNNALITLICIGGLALTTGCESTSATRSAPRDARAVVCPKCEIVWVEGYDMNDPYMLTMVTEKKMKCPDCESAVAHFFRTGQLKHHCASCGGALWHCEHE